MEVARTAEAEIGHRIIGANGAAQPGPHEGGIVIKVARAGSAGMAGRMSNRCTCSAAFVAMRAASSEPNDPK